MKHFFTLVEFEYRKIWKRKSAILAMSIPAFWYPY